MDDELYVKCPNCGTDIDVEANEDVNAYIDQEASEEIEKRWSDARDEIVESHPLGSEHDWRKLAKAIRDGDIFEAEIHVNRLIAGETSLEHAVSLGRYSDTQRKAA